MAVRYGIWYIGLGIDPPTWFDGPDRIEFEDLNAAYQWRAHRHGLFPNYVYEVKEIPNG